LGPSPGLPAPTCRAGCLPESATILAGILDGATLLLYNRGQSVAEAVNLAEEVFRG
jgi:hypothetical protein